MIADITGRIISDYQANIPDRIVISGLNTGTYIVNIETDKGRFSEKFIK